MPNCSFNQYMLMKCSQTQVTSRPLYIIYVTTYYITLKIKKKKKFSLFYPTFLVFIVNVFTSLLGKIQLLLSLKFRGIFLSTPKAISKDFSLRPYFTISTLYWCLCLSMPYWDFAQAYQHIYHSKKANVTL